MPDPYVTRSRDQGAPVKTILLGLLLLLPAAVLPSAGASHGVEDAGVAASGYGATVTSPALDVTRYPRAQLGDDRARTHHVADLAGLGTLTGLTFVTQGTTEASWDGQALAQATARTEIAAVEVPGVLTARGITVHAESHLVRNGAFSFSEVSFASLEVGGIEVDVGHHQAPRTIEVPGLATVHLHEQARTGDGQEDTGITATALRVVWTDPGPAQELVIGSATTGAGYHTEPAPLDDAPPLDPPLPILGGGLP